VGVSGVPASVRAYRVKHEHFGEVVYVDVRVEAEGFRVFLWKCPHCGAAFKSLSLRQLASNIENHRRKHVDVDWGG